MGGNHVYKCQLELVQTILYSRFYSIQTTNDVRDKKKKTPLEHPETPNKRPGEVEVVIVRYGG